MTAQDMNLSQHRKTVPYTVPSYRSVTRQTRIARENMATLASTPRHARAPTCAQAPTHARTPGDDHRRFMLGFLKDLLIFSYLKDFWTFNTKELPKKTTKNK